MLYYDKLRYRLLPYIYSLSGKVYLDDYTLMRALVMDFGDDKNVLNIGTEFMYGPSLLVAPVTEHKARTWPVYLPAGTGWYDFHTGKYFEGGATIKADAPLEHMPLFVKAGAILPTGPELQYTSEKKADPLTLYVYTGANGAFDLYEDEGLTNDYQKGQYTIIPFSYDDASQTLKIGERKGTYAGMPERRTIEIVWVSKEQPVGISLSAKAPRVVKYEGKEVSVTQ
jgi:alpha-D-xyloside xylohydrolase